MPLPRSKLRRRTALTVDDSSRYLWIQNHKLFRKMNDAVANLVVELPAHGKDQEIGDELQILKQIASFLGLPTRETDRVVRSVYEVWGEC